MSRIKSKNTEPERRLAAGLAFAGIHFHKWSDLPGKPDMVLSRNKVAIFVDGCYWHSCPIHGSRPKSNQEFWDSKLARNKERDGQVTAILYGMGYAVLRFWECDVKHKLKQCIARVRSYG